MTTQFQTTGSGYSLLFQRSNACTTEQGRSRYSAEVGRASSTALWLVAWAALAVAACARGDLERTYGNAPATASTPTPRTEYPSPCPEVGEDEASSCVYFVASLNACNTLARHCPGDEEVTILTSGADHDRVRGGFDIDEEYYYWTTRQGIRRKPKPPL